MCRLARLFTARRIKAAVLAALLIAPLLALLIGDQLDRRHRGPPPPGVQDLESFLRWRTPGRYHLIMKDGNEYLLLACGPVGWVWRGGPTAYVFDKSGRLVDWTADAESGLGPGFQRRWPLVPPRRELDRLEEVRNWPDLPTSQTQPSAP